MGTALCDYFIGSPYCEINKKIPDFVYISTPLGTQMLLSADSTTNFNPTISIIYKNQGDDVDLSLVIDDVRQRLKNKGLTKLFFTCIDEEDEELFKKIGLKFDINDPYDYYLDL